MAIVGVKAARQTY